MNSERHIKTTLLIHKSKTNFKTDQQHIRNIISTWQVQDKFTKQKNMNIVTQHQQHYSNKIKT